MRLEGGRYDQVLPRRQFEARAHLAQVDEGFRPGRLRVGQEEVLIQVHLPLALELWGEDSQPLLLFSFLVLWPRTETAPCNGSSRLCVSF